MSLLGSKIATMALMGLVSLFLGLIPLKLSQYLGWSESGRKKNLLTSILLCFGAGVLIATCFLHIIPEINEELIHSQHSFNNFTPITMTMVLVCSGFFAIYLLEEVVSYVVSRSPGNFLIHQTASHSHQSETAMVSSSNLTLAISMAPSISNGNAQPEVEVENPEPNGSAQPSSVTEVDFCNPKYAGSQLSDTAKSMFPNYHSPEETAATKAPDNKIQLRDFLTVLALSFHTVFEGLAIGLEPKEDSIWQLFVAIAVHQYVILFCIGMELVAAKTPSLVFYVYIVSLSLMSPLGIGIGIIITHSLSSNHLLIIAILQGIAAGTIIYVVMFEIMAREKAKTNIPGLIQVSFTLVGFLLMLIIQYFGGHSHDHGAHDGHHFHNETKDSLNSIEHVHENHIHDEDHFHIHPLVVNGSNY